MKRIVIITIWAIAFGFVEASVVEYLRAIYYPLSSGGFQFPMLTLDLIHEMGFEHNQRLQIEVVRELCTLIMLATVSMAAAQNRREAWAYFMITFGVWDISYYVWLKIFLGWPTGVMAWDLLFLIPVPWVAPVIAPVVISIALIASGLTVLYFEERKEPLELEWKSWILIVAGGIVVIMAFCWDYQNIVAGGFPQPFQWVVFLVGLGISATTFLLGVFRRLI
ncbi:MAG: hypothetical protein V1897_01575 [Pseudomonadota bacterium]